MATPIKIGMSDSPHSVYVFLLLNKIENYFQCVDELKLTMAFAVSAVDTRHLQICHNISIHSVFVIHFLSYLTVCWRFDTTKQAYFVTTLSCPEWFQYAYISDYHHLFFST